MSGGRRLSEARCSLRVATTYKCGILFFSKILDTFLVDYCCIASVVAYKDLMVETSGKDSVRLDEQCVYHQ
ncbi:Hypothetical predicted protein [Scomber scombrus]|uniref:Uncharacterized protein n=1 Tax=Scomber scombrus TaxID=13677 RepID=A0AAV1MW95_SCOSC